MVQKFRPETLYIKKSVPELDGSKVSSRNFICQEVACREFSYRNNLFRRLYPGYTEKFYAAGCYTGTFYVGRFISEVFIPKISVLQVPVQGRFCAKNRTNSTQQKRSVIRPLLFVGMKENK